MTGFNNLNCSLTMINGLRCHYQDYHITYILWMVYHTLSQSISWFNTMNELSQDFFIVLNWHQAIRVEGSQNNSPTNLKITRFGNNYAK